MSGFPWHFGALQFTLLWRSSENTLLPHWFLIPFRLSTIFTVWNVKNLEKLFVLCWQIYFSGFLSALFQQFTSFHQKLTFKAITYFSFPTFFLFSTNIILSRFHVFLVCSLLYVAQMLLLSEEPYRLSGNQSPGLGLTSENWFVFSAGGGKHNPIVWNNVERIIGS